MRKLKKIAVPLFFGVGILCVVLGPTIYYAINLKATERKEDNFPDFPVELLARSVAGMKEGEVGWINLDSIIIGSPTKIKPTEILSQSAPKTALILKKDGLNLILVKSLFYDFKFFKREGEGFVVNRIKVVNSLKDLE